MTTNRSAPHAIVPDTPRSFPWQRALARRTDHIQPFEVMEYVKRAAELEARGKPVIHMSIGQPDFTAPPAVMDALAAAIRQGGDFGYTGATGIAPLREAIAGHYRDRYGLSIDPARVIVTAGGSAALLLACMALVEPGAEVLLTDPTYPCNRHFVASADGKPVLIPVGPDTAFQMTAEHVRRHWTERTAGVLLASPANPTGTSIPADEMRAIVDEVRARNGFTIVDEIYLDLSYGPFGASADDPAARPQSVAALGDDVIVLNSFSKYFNMTGWRLGWLIAPPALVPVFEKLAQNIYICPSALAQQAALACFRPETIAIYDQRREAFRQRRDYIVPAIESVGLTVPVKPDGAFYVYVDCSGTGQSSSEFCRRLLDESWVCLVPGADFGFADPQRYLRLSYATALPKLEEAIGRIRRYL